MKYVLYLLMALLVISCKTENKEKTERKDKIKKTDTLKIKKADTLKSKPTKPKKSHLSKLLDKGLVIADSTESCSSNRFETEPKTKLVFEFPRNQKLILSEWTDGVTGNNLGLLEFLIYDCVKDTILLESLYTIADYRIKEIQPNLVIDIHANVPSKSQNDRILFGRKVFKERNGDIIVENKVLYEPTSLTNSRKKALINMFNQDLSLIDLENNLADLFIGTINGD